MADAIAVPPINTPWYLDKAFYAKLLMPVAVLATAWINAKLPIPMSAETLDIVMGGVCAGFVSFIVATKTKTTILQKAQIEAGAAVEAVKNEDPAKVLAEPPKP